MDTKELERKMLLKFRNLCADEILYWEAPALVLEALCKELDMYDLEKEVREWRIDQ